MVEVATGPEKAAYAQQSRMSNDMTDDPLHRREHLATALRDQAQRSFPLNVHQFMVLGGEWWNQAFKVKVGKRATKLHAEELGRPPEKARARDKDRNETAIYPRGIIERAFEDAKTDILAKALADGADEYEAYAVLDSYRGTPYRKEPPSVEEIEKRWAHPTTVSGKEAHRWNRVCAACGGQLDAADKPKAQKKVVKLGDPSSAFVGRSLEEQLLELNLNERARVIEMREKALKKSYKATPTERTAEYVGALLWMLPEKERTPLRKRELEWTVALIEFGKPLSDFLKGANGTEPPMWGEDGGPLNEAAQAELDWAWSERIRITRSGTTGKRN